jgi:SHS2 domain-containing protein
MFETFEHTADLGLRIRTATLDELFAEAAWALFSTLVEDLATVAPNERVEISIAGNDRDYLLFDWLKELLYRFDAEHLLFSRFEVRVNDAGLSGAAWGEKLDWDRHVLRNEVKAITYHGLKVERDGDGWLAEFIIDI